MTPRELDEQVANKLSIANAILGIIAESTIIIRKSNRWYVRWTQYSGSDVFERPYATPRGSHYPSWHRYWGHGGTCAYALNQLVRWVRGQSVLPLSTWRYWTGESVALGRSRGPEIVEMLAAGGYPQSVPCVLCGKQIERAGDWWSLDKIEGPSCSMRDCRDLNLKGPRR